LGILESYKSLFTIESSVILMEEEIKQEVKPKKPSMIEDARAAAAELKEQNLLRLEILKKEEEILARRETLNALGGDSSAGSKPEKKQESPAEYAARVLKGEI
jgi:hypothetical protein